ncbi:xylulokinase [Oxalobacteraceae bacterium GrIS 2.11]
MTHASNNYLGIDLGTSEVKALIMGSGGQVLGVAHAPLVWQQPQAGWAEQDPHSWWDAVIKACQQLKHNFPDQYAQIAAIGLSGQMHGATLLDEQNQVLRPCILWNDARSEKQCATLTAQYPELHQIAGNLAMPGFTAPKLAWLREHEPDTFKKVAKVLLPKDYLRFLLSGQMVSEMSDAAGTLWLDVEKRTWSSTLLEATGLSLQHMPGLVEGSQVSAHLNAESAALLGLKSGIPIAGGAGDNAASAIGIGAVNTGDSFISLGTSGVLFSVTDRHRPNVGEAVHAFCHALPAKWHQMTVMLTAASALKWITQLTGSASEEELLKAVANLDVAERKLAPIFLPYMSGERTPHNDASASGTFIGLRHNHRAAHMAYAVIEGVSFGMRDGLDALKRAGTSVSTLQLVGGGSKSHFWAQLLANTLETPVRIGQESSVGAALGAARLAQLCVNEPTQDQIERICSKPITNHEFQPQIDEAIWLEKRQQLFRSTYQQLKPVFRAAAE